MVILVWDRCCRLQEFRDSAGVPRIVRGGTVGGFGDTFVQVSPLTVWLARVALYFCFCLQPSRCIGGRAVRTCHAGDGPTWRRPRPVAHDTCATRRARGWTGPRLRSDRLGI